MPTGSGPGVTNAKMQPRVSAERPPSFPKTNAHHPLRSATQHDTGADLVGQGKSFKEANVRHNQILRLVALDDGKARGRVAFWCVTRAQGAVLGGDRGV